MIASIVAEQPGAFAAVLAVVGAFLGGGAVGLYKARTDKGATVLSSTSEAAESIAKAAQTLIAPLQAEVSAQRKRIDDLEVEVRMLTEGIAEVGKLRTEIVSLHETIVRQLEEIASLKVEINGALDGVSGPPGLRAEIRKLESTISEQLHEIAELTRNNHG